MSRSRILFHISSGKYVKNIVDRNTFYCEIMTFLVLNFKDHFSFIRFRKNNSFEVLKRTRQWSLGKYFFDLRIGNSVKKSLFLQTNERSYGIKLKSSY